MADPSIGRLLSGRAGDSLRLQVEYDAESEVHTGHDAAGQRSDPIRKSIAVDGDDL